MEGRRVWTGVCERDGVEVGGGEEGVCEVGRVCVRGMEWRWGGGEEGVDGCV